MFIAIAVFAWRAWGWLGPAGIIAYAFVLGAWTDEVSPWPSYRRVLKLIRTRLQSGAAGIEGLLLLPVVEHIDSELKKGTHFEAATTDVWISRSLEMTRNAAATRTQPEDRGRG